MDYSLTVSLYSRMLRNHIMHLAFSFLLFSNFIAVLHEYLGDYIRVENQLSYITSQMTLKICTTLYFRKDTVLKYVRNRTVMRKIANNLHVISLDKYHIDPFQPRAGRAIGSFHSAMEYVSDDQILI